MKNIKLVVIIALFSILQNFGQNHLINGLVKDENNQTISYGNVILLSKNGEFIKGTTSNNKGKYRFENLTKSTYIIKVSVLGFESFQKQFTLEEQNTVLNINLKNSTETLNQVEISSKKPLISQKSDRLIFNISNSILSDKTAWEVLKHTPNVFVNQEQLILKGAAAEVYVNDKKIKLEASELKSYLAGLNGNNIKAIEVIDNPSAKYEANSNGIINIVLKKKTSLGYKGSINTSYEQGFYPKYSIGTSHFYTTKKIDLFANYTFNSEKDKITMDETIYYFDNNDLIDSKSKSFYNIVSNTNTHNLIFNIDYKLGKKSKLSLSTSNFFEPSKTTDNQANGHFLDLTNNPTSNYNAQSVIDNNKQNLSYALDFHQALKKEGEKISVGIAYDYYNNSDNQHTNTNYLLADNTFNNANIFRVNSNQKIQIYAAQADYTLPLKKQMQFEAGVKTSQITSNSENKQFNFDGTNYILNPINSDDFEYNEMNYAAYSSITKTWKKWYAQFGLRGEQTATTGKSLSLNQTDDNSYFKIFPTAYLSYFPSDKHDFSISYGKRIERPKYRQLNPFHYYLSDFAVNIGNPKLRPAITHKLDFVYVYKGAHRFNLFYSKQIDKVQELSYQENTSPLIQFIMSNLKEGTNAGFNYYGSFGITKRWSLTSNIVLYYKENKFRLVDNQQQLATEKLWREVVQLTNNFTFLKDKSLTSSLQFVYASPSIVGSYVQNKRNWINIDFRKRILKNKASITLQFNDIFNTDNLNFVSKYGNQYNGYVQKNDSRTVKLGFIYNFGNRKLRENKTTKTSAEKDRME